MGVPAHDERDFEFAKKYNLPIKSVIAETNESTTDKTLIKPYIDKGILINSGDFDGLNFEQAFIKVEKILGDKKLATTKVNYRLRDWGVSRQRYWGCPIPIVHCKECGQVVVPEEQLPVILPENIPLGVTGSQLAKMPEFYMTKCPKCGIDAHRETDTMDTFVDSSWYYARYASPDCHNKILDERVNYWAPVDQYIGGVEHAILHLLYARFFHKCLRDLGLVKSDEPFTRLLTQGMVVADTFYREDSNGRKTWFNPADIKCTTNDKGKVTHATYVGDNQSVTVGTREKMSKSKNNGVDPQTIIDRYGVDTARLFIMFAAPPELSLEWSDNGIEGANRFIRRLWRIVYQHIQLGLTEQYISGELTEEQKKLRIQLHQTINKVTYDIEMRQQFNTAIAAIMELINSYSKVTLTNSMGHKLSQEILENVVIMLSPIIPHVCEELWQSLRPNTELLDQMWVVADSSLLNTDELEMIIQVNGKLRGKIIITKSTTKEQIEVLAKENPNVQKFIKNVTIKKLVIVQNKLVNIVV